MERRLLIMIAGLAVAVIFLALSNIDTRAVLDHAMAALEACHAAPAPASYEFPKSGSGKVAIVRPGSGEPGDPCLNSVCFDGTAGGSGKAVAGRAGNAGASRGAGRGGAGGSAYVTGSGQAVGGRGGDGGDAQ